MTRVYSESYRKRMRYAIKGRKPRTAPKAKKCRSPFDEGVGFVSCAIADLERARRRGDEVASYVR